MGKLKETVTLYICERCGHKWIPKQLDVEPRVCPKCKSPYWNRPKKVLNTQHNKG
jgi:predicted Zn-ribbon and HTH transcriptional regulator